MTYDLAVASWNTTLPVPQGNPNARFKIFWKWTLDRYKMVDEASSPNNYWKVLKMHLLDKTGRNFDQRERRDIKNVKCRSLYFGKPQLTFWPCAIHQLAHQTI